MEPILIRTDLINIILSILLLFSAGFFALIGNGMKKNQLNRNNFFGIRCKKAFESEDNWRKMNIFCGNRMFFWSVILSIFALVVFFIPLETNQDPNLLLIFALACFPGFITIVLLIEIQIFSKKL